MTGSTAELVGIVARWVAFAATLLVLGVCGFRVGLRAALVRGMPDLAPHLELRAARLGLVAGIALLLALAGKVLAQAGAFLDPGDPISADLLGTIIRSTSWGKGWTAQIAASVLAIAGFALARTGLRPGWLAALFGASTVALAAPLTGHATAADRAGYLGYPLDVIHVLGAGVWLGTLAVTVLIAFVAARTLEPDHRGRAVKELVEAFHPIALVSATLVVLAGTLLAAQYLEWSIPALWQSRYGRTLGLKLLVLAGVAALGRYNWRTLKPALGGPEGAARIRRSSTFELGFGIILLLVTAVLVSQPMPGEE